MPFPIQLILADDHPVITQGVKAILENEKNFEIIAEFKDGQSLLQSPLINNADVLLLDLNMPRIDGLQVLEYFKGTGIKLKIIVISAYTSQKLISECYEAGASAYIVKTENLNSLSEIIIQVMNGKKIFPDFHSEVEPDDKFSYLDNFLIKYKLTKREVEIIKMVCDGKTSSDIAEKLSLSPFTVQTHRKNIFKKLSLDSSNPMAMHDFASKSGLI